MTIEQLEKIEWLNRPYHVSNKANSLRAVDEQNKKLKELAKGGSEENAKEIAELVDKNAKKIDEYVNSVAKVRFEVADAIEAIHDDDCEALLNNHYLGYLTWEKTAEVMNYSVSGIKKKHKKALDKITIKSRA